MLKRKLKKRKEVIPSQALYPTFNRPAQKYLKELGNTRELRGLRALNALEAYTIKLRIEAYDLADRYDGFRKEQLERGLLMYDTPVTPEDAGFTASMEKVKIGTVEAEKHVFRKKDFSLWFFKEGHWVVLKESWGRPIIMKLNSMTDFLICMNSIGVEISVTDVILKG